MPRSVIPRPLTAEAFAPFGDVIEVNQARARVINEGYTIRFHDLARLDVTGAEGRPTISIFRSTPRELPIVLSMMERHPKSSQAFFPLGDESYLVAVAPPGDLDPARIEVFLAGPDQGVNYHAGTWHHYSLALGRISDFLVVDRDAEDDNCDEVRLAPGDEIAIEPGGLS